MKKVGYFFLGFVPFIVAEIIQFSCLAFMYGLSFLLKANIGGIDYSKGFSDLVSIWSNLNFNILLMINYAVISICVFGVWYYAKCEGDFKPDVKKTFNAPLIISVIILVPGAQFAANYICAMIQYLVPSWWETYQKLIETSGLGSFNALMVFYSIILPPICEELIFRGVTLRIFKLSVPFWLANILQAAMFGLFHLNWVQGCYAFVLGLILGYVCEKGKSIYYSIGLHFLFNFWGTFVSALLSGIKNTVVLGLLMIVITITSLVYGFLLFHLGLMSRERKNAAQ